MGVEFNEISEKSNGGTELLQRRLDAALSLHPELNEKVQIIASRIRELDPNKHRILWLHDLADDPESGHLANDGWGKFHKLVFVSHWQRRAYIEKFGIPWSKTVVMQNAIEPIEVGDKLSPENWKKDKIRLIYHTTPHRGLGILVPVMKKLAEDFPGKLHLDVFSSFAIYGWEGRDEPYKPMFEEITAHQDMTYHGVVSNEEVREALVRSDVFAYPSVWPETSCLSLMEAMSAGCVCVHPDLAALPETGSNMTTMYNWHETPQSHAGVIYGMLTSVIHSLLSGSEDLHIRTLNSKQFADIYYNWPVRANQWLSLIEHVTQTPLELPESKPLFVYRS